MRKKFSLFSCVVLLFACGNANSSQSGSGDKDIKADKKLSREVADCFKRFDDKYDELLTKADIAKHVDIDEDSFNMENSSYGSCAYQWNSNRPDLKLEMFGQTIKGRDRNRVEIKRLSFYTDVDLEIYSKDTATDLFDRSYKKLSQQDYDELLANLKEKYADDSDSYEQAKGFLNARLNLIYEPVPNLGDRAYWKWHKDHGIELVVLTGVVHFTIESKTTAEQQSSLDDAVKFAREVLAKCAL